MSFVKRPYPLVLLIFVSLIFMAVPAGSGVRVDKRYKEGELIVKFRRSASEGSRSRAHASAGAGVLKSIELGRRSGPGKSAIKDRFVVERVKLPAGLSVEDAARLYAQDPDVEYAEPNYIVKKAVLPDDAYFSKQWGLDNTGQTIVIGLNHYAGTVDADIDAPEAWDVHAGSGTIVVAVLDTGIDYAHSDLSANIWSNSDEISGNSIDDDGNGYVDDVMGWNFANNNNNPMDDDIDGGHGTHVAGIIGAVGNNATGTSGVNWSVKLMPIKFLAANGSGTLFDVVDGIAYAVDNGASIINASYVDQANCTPTPPYSMERDAINAAASAGVLFVAAAGNDGCDNDSTPYYPASHDLSNIISVAASDMYDSRPSWSNYGAASVDIAAPGDLIYSTIRRVYGSYDFFSGTSMATPFVSGVAALVWSYHPTYTYQDVKDAILYNSDSNSAFSSITVSGGRLNAYGALIGGTAQNQYATPSNLNYAAAEPSNVQIYWIDEAAGETGYEVYRKAGGGSYALLATLGADSTSYVDATALDGSVYYYKVRAYGVDGYSDFAVEVIVTVPINAPTSLVLEARSSSSAQLSWQDNSSAEEGFTIERSVAGGAYQYVALSAADSTSYLDTGLTPSTAYSYRVSATNSTGHSSYIEGTVTTSEASASSGGGGCFIATAAYGTPLSSKVETLRRFRDAYLLTNAPGRAFVSFYYWASPPIAELVSSNGLLRHIVRTILDPIVWAVELVTGDSVENKSNALYDTGKYMSSEPTSRSIPGAATPASSF